ncbi:MAG TPA: STAS domain-containing protein [Mycobacteriales bacterium]|nr:STAS domain-containing protein [Mycobacteriales bacterium]
MLGDVSVRPDATVARPHGDLDVVNVDALRELLDGLCAGPARTIILDLSDVTFMDVLSLSVILGAADAMRDLGRQLVVENPSTAVRRLCDLLNAGDVLDAADSLPYIVIPPAC